MSDAEEADADLADLREIWRFRAFEERVRELHIAGDVVGSTHLDIGQEAIPVAVASGLGPDDAVFATYRGHGYALACGVPPVAMFAEVLGRSTGINGGRGGSAYLTAPSYRFYGENSIVGAGTPIACGAALAGRYDGTNRVAFPVFGDGAMNQGSVHESLNFAAEMDLPVVFICVNNGWSELTPIADVVRDDRLYLRAAAYGIPGQRVDGNDPGAVRAVLRDAVREARNGRGPAFIEATTARLVGHYIGDANQYRSKAEMDLAQASEPTVKLAERLLRAGVPEAEIAAAETAAVNEMLHASAEALAAPLADPSTAGDYVYV